MPYQHTPVMLKEVLEYLRPRTGQSFIDCTLGGGGYTAALAEKAGRSGRVLAIDLDQLAITNAEKKFAGQIKNKNIILAHDNFKNLPAIVGRNFEAGARFDGVVFDLGLSSAQLADQSRGFSFHLSGAPLKMSFGSSALTAGRIVNQWSREELAGIFKEYGEEKFAGKIAAAILSARAQGEIATAGQLAEIIERVVPKRFSGKLHPATKVFQALRVAVNDELNNLSQALPAAIVLLKPGGRIAVISYHSLEDRIVKRFFRQESRDCLCPPAAPVCACGHRAALKLITKSVSRPGKEEVANNPRARSAKLRVAEKI